MATKLPAVLSAKNPSDSLSMERALNQIFILLHAVETKNLPEVEDMVNASIDAVQTMLAAIDRG